MHTNDIFLFFKNYFLHQHIKTIQNIQTILNFLQTWFAPHSQTCSKYTTLPIHQPWPAPRQSHLFPVALKHLE